MDSETVEENPYEILLAEEQDEEFMNFYVQVNKETETWWTNWSSSVYIIFRNFSFTTMLALW